MRATGSSAKVVFALVALLFALVPAKAQTVDSSKDLPDAASGPVEKPAPYDDKLARLSEVIGAVHYLRNLCNKDGEPEWRQAMQSLVDAETADEPHRRARMISAYNRSYRSFASVYTTCTASAIAAESLYRNEGATLAGEIAARYGN
ncbi:MULTISPECIES: TIGR02301 family protein [Alphaproteobacteria]|uniref:TIGR02301 family protein n=2 Tax=Alphaproteobacteria TaxID=28211 RepID=A0A512HGE0_9HYPH|nr:MULTISPECIES: TIGR02301 family protein [Alphaproteobacteria]GEO84501.1 TIGR02301 family protein [Ciceribacter naphthalenivorans]GLR22464.1 TIGR02301 family protein [Ciceribacter naphthalenivorans]GLT05320.1 TIGR02301 family protein [Sphingomonas psychrolutea]